MKQINKVIEKIKKKKIYLLISYVIYFFQLNQNFKKNFLKIIYTILKYH